MKIVAGGALAVLVTLCGCSRADQFVMYAEEALEYTVLRGNSEYLGVGVDAWGPDWRWFGFEGAPASAEGGTRSVRLSSPVPGGEATATLEHRAQADGHDSVSLKYSLSADAQTELTQIVVRVVPREGAFRGGRCLATLADGSEVSLDLPFGRQDVGDAVSSLALVDSTGQVTRIAVEPPRPMSADGAGRIQIAGAELPAAVWRETTLRLTLPGSVQFVASQEEATQRTDTSGWFPCPVGLEGVPIDLSFLNQDDRSEYIPAGTHGFLTVDGDRFVFEDGTPARFWGVNVTAGGALGPPERARQIAERLARLGVNVVRLHHLDSWANPIVDYDHPDGTTQHLDASSMRALDRTIYELKQRGIYVILDPWVQRCFTAADGVADYGSLGHRGNFNLHPYVYFDPRMQELIGLQWESVWNHVNEFTGVAYKDEPALILTEVINEGLFLSLDGIQGEYYRELVTKRYEEWAARNGGLPLEQSSIFSQNYGENNIRFFMDVHRQFYREMASRLRQAGVRVPINATNWAHWTWVLATQTDQDFMDAHHYYGGDRIGPGHGLGGLWLSHPLGLPGTPFGPIASFAVAGKPLTSSECGNNPPKTYRAAYPIGLATVAAFQEWDSITGYAFTQSSSPQDRLSPYEWEADPVTLAAMAVGALIYRRGDVAPARETVTLSIPEEELYILRWENDGARQIWNLPGFNAAIEEHRVTVSLPGGGTSRHAGATLLTPDAAWEYRHPFARLESDTGEFWRDWQYGVGGIDTSRTQVAYGFLGRNPQPVATERAVFATSAPFAVLALCSLTDAPIETSPRLLVTAMARAENSGMAYNLAGDRIVDEGRGPVLCEPVQAEVRFHTTARALRLRPVGTTILRPVPIQDGWATVQLGGTDGTLFFEIDAE